MKKQLLLLMDRSSSYILRNREKSSLVISFLLSVGTLSIIGLFFQEPNFEAPLSEKITFTITYSDPVLASEPVTKPEPVIDSKPVVEKQPTPEVIPKPEPIKEKPTEPKTQIEQEENPKPIIEEVKSPEPVLEIESLTKTETQIEPLTATRAYSMGVDKQNIELEERITPYETLSKGLNLKQPDYPKSAIKWKKQGSVLLEIAINRDGSIKNVTLIESSGHSILDNHCIKTVKKKWKFNSSDKEIITRKKFIFKLV